MTPRQIRKIMKQKKVTQKSIAKNLKVFQGSVSRVISKDFESRRIQEAIANAVGLSFDEVWG